MSVPEEISQSKCAADEFSVVNRRRQAALPFRLPETGFVRMRNLHAPHGPIPASRATIYAWIKAGLFPAPVPIGPGRIKGFRVEDVREFLAQPDTSQAIVAANTKPRSYSSANR